MSDSDGGESKSSLTLMRPRSADKKKAGSKARAASDTDDEPGSAKSPKKKNNSKKKNPKAMKRSMTDAVAAAMSAGDSGKEAEFDDDSTDNGMGRSAVAPAGEGPSRRGRRGKAPTKGKAPKGKALAKFRAAGKKVQTANRLQRMFHNDIDQDFGLLECLFHLVGLVCCVMIGTSLLTKDMYTLSRSTPEGLSMSTTFQHTVYDFEDIDTMEKFEEWLTEMILTHYVSTPLQGMPTAMNMTAEERAVWGEGCDLVKRPFGDYGMVLNGGIMVSQSRGKVKAGSFKADNNPFGEAWVSSVESSSAAASSAAACPCRVCPCSDHVPKNQSFNFLKILKTDFLTIPWGTDDSELGVKFPFGEGFHYRFAPDMSEAAAKQALQEFWSSGFIGPDSRMVHVTMWYEVEWARVEVAIMFSIEISMAGFLFPHWTFKSLERSEDDTVWILIYVLGAVYGIQFFKECWEIFGTCVNKVFCSEYLSEIWNYIDWANMAFFAYFVLKYKLSHEQQLPDAPDIADSCYMKTVAFVESNVYQKVKGSYSFQLAFFLALTIWRTLKYLQLSPALVVPFKALTNSVKEILALLVVLGIVMFGFAWIFHAKYNHLTEFHNMTTALMSLICIMCGSLDPSELFDGYGRTYKAEGQIVSAAFVFVNSFILLNVFISIMCTQYEKAQKIYG